MIYKPFILECQRISDIATQYKDKCQFYFEELCHKVVREEYSVGGEVLHRGYYCPSPIYDIVVGNANRGKLLKRQTSRSNPTYKYGFDMNDNLITISQSYNNEFIIWNGETEIGISFSKDFGIEHISECFYNGRQIQSYVFCLYNQNENHIVQYQRENYEYSEFGLKTADFMNFFENEKPPILQHDKYHFQHDNEGFLSKYTVVEYDGDSIKDSVWKNHVFDVNIERKV